MSRIDTKPVTSAKANQAQEIENDEDFPESKHPAYLWALIAGSYPILLVVLVSIALVVLYFVAV